MICCFSFVQLNMNNGSIILADGRQTKRDLLRVLPDKASLCLVTVPQYNLF